MTVPDARAALLAVRDISDKPVLVSFTCDENGRTLTGTDVQAALVIFQGMGVDAFGLNCSTGPEEMLVQARRLAEYAEVPLAIKPNAGLPETAGGKAVYNCPPEEFVRYTGEFAKLGAALFGGCCGTCPEHIAALKTALEDFELIKPGTVRREAADHSTAEGSSEGGKAVCSCKSADGQIVCATEKDIFVLEAGIETGEILECGIDLAEEIRKANRSDREIISVRIEREADLDEFEAAQYAVRKPLCIVCDDATLLDQALTLYQGRALYAGNLPDSELIPLVRRYGLII